MIFVFILVLTLLIESVYCDAMKKRARGALSNQGQIIEAQGHQECITTNIKNKAYRVVVFFDDLTFLFFKLVGYIPSHFIRMCFYKYVFHMDIGKKAVIYYGLEARYPWNISIGEGTIIGDHAILDGRKGIVIGDNVNISTGVWMWTVQHDVNSPSFSVEGKGGPIVVGNRAWISSRSTILPNCNISEGVVIAASAVVTKSCEEAFAIYAGVPAKKVAKRNEELTYIFDGTHRLFI